MKPIYAERIREVRQRAGLTQTEFAQIIGTTKNQLSKYETNTQDTPTKVIISVCEKFNIDANWLMGLDVNTLTVEAFHSTTKPTIPGEVIKINVAKK